jgi:hypothetical protein
VAVSSELVKTALKKIQNDKLKGKTFRVRILQCIEMVRKYEKMGYYNLAKPEFISEVITTFTNLELSKKDVIRANNFMNITILPFSITTSVISGKAVIFSMLIFLF